MDTRPGPTTSPAPAWTSRSRRRATSSPFPRVVPAMATSAWRSNPTSRSRSTSAGFFDGREPRAGDGDGAAVRRGCNTTGITTDLSRRREPHQRRDEQAPRVWHRPKTRSIAEFATARERLVPRSPDAPRNSADRPSVHDEGMRRWRVCRSTVVVLALPGSYRPSVHDERMRSSRVCRSTVAALALPGALLATSAGGDEAALGDGGLLGRRVVGRDPGGRPPGWSGHGGQRRSRRGVGTRRRATARSRRRRGGGGPVGAGDQRTARGGTAGRCGRVPRRRAAPRPHRPDRRDPRRARLVGARRRHLLRSGLAAGALRGDDRDVRCGAASTRRRACRRTVCGRSAATTTPSTSTR